MVKPVPDRCHTVNVYLVVPQAAEAVKFYEQALGAELLTRMEGPGGSTMHAEIGLGDSTIMLSDENPDWGTLSPKSLGGCPASVHLYVDDADALFSRAVDAGCEVLFPMADMFWGDRYGKIKDPYGHQWGIATHKEDVSDDEMQRRMQEFFQQQTGSQA